MHPDMVLVEHSVVQVIELPGRPVGVSNMASRIRTRTLGWVTAAWMGLVAAVLVWQTVRYNGIVGWLAEWQFRTFDRFFPVATVVLLTALLSLPFAVLIFVRLRKSYRAGPASSSRHLLDKTAIASVFFKFGILASAGIAVVLFFVGLAQGSLADKPVVVNLDTLAAGSPTQKGAEGRIRLRATVLLDRVGYYREGFLFTSRELWVAPLVSDPETKAFTTFVQVNRTKAEDPRQVEIVGYLKPESIPGGLAQLYRNAGYRVSEKPNLIYADLRSVRWPYWSAAADFAVLLLILSLAALFHNNYRKRLGADEV